MGCQPVIVVEGAISDREYGQLLPSKEAEKLIKLVKY